MSKRRKKSKIIVDSNKPTKYVMYLRKSSEGEDAQAKSIPDQQAECFKYASFHNLDVVEVITESASAWISGNRPKFKEMIKNLKKGKYDGIIAYHPDRLSRNALEAGIVIDMFDAGEIKSLKFPTLEVENTGNGKLLLGILFTMSKNYTDHQSEVVQRGVSSNHAQGKSNGVEKWGYSRDVVTGYYIPNEHFEIIQKGWYMRAEGSTLNQVLDYWKQNDVKRTPSPSKRNKNPRTVHLHAKNQASRLFKDPFYYGIFIQANKEKDLRSDFSANFKPMISQEMYESIQEETNAKKAKINLPNPKGSKPFLPLRGLVVCNQCNKNMQVGASKGKKAKYLYFRCSNKECPVKNIRAKYIFDALYEILDSFNFTEKEYREYTDYIGKNSAERVEALGTQRRSLQGELNALERKIKELNGQYLLLDDKAPESLRNELSKTIDKKYDRKITIEEEIQRIGSILVDADRIRLTKEEFLNTLKTLPQQMRNGDARQKDILCRNLLLNTRIDNQKTPSFIWREPFDQVVQLQEIMSGTREKTRTSTPLALVPKTSVSTNSTTRA